MLDFAKLARRTPIEQEADELRRQAEATALDRTRRRERSHRSIALTLTLDAELRFTVAGGSCLHLRGRDVRARTLSAIWFAPDDFDQDRVHAIIDALRAWTALSLDGYWRSRVFKGTRLFEFVAQYIAIGDEPRIP